jgi:hypothetical protein
VVRAWVYRGVWVLPWGAGESDRELGWVAGMTRGADGLLTGPSA